jgi:hypothetical protein
MGFQGLSHDLAMTWWTWWTWAKDSLRFWENLATYDGKSHGFSNGFANPLHPEETTRSIRI